MKLRDIIDTLDATLICGNVSLEREVQTAGASDLMSDILAGFSDGCVLLTGLTTIQVIRTAIVTGVGAIVFVRHKRPTEEVIELARAENLPLISTPYSMFVSCGRLHDRGITGLDGSR
jgi:predicted transcriptional regulator